MTSTTRTTGGRGRRIAAVALAALSFGLPLFLARSVPVAAQEQPPATEAPAPGFTGGGQGYLLDDDRFRSIAVPGATGTLPFGINNRRQIVGIYDDAQGRSHGFLWERGRYRTLRVPVATGTTPEGISGSGAFSINNRGQIVGAYVDSDGRTRGCVWDRGRFRTIDAPDATDTVAFGINDRGRITLQASSPENPSLHFVLDDDEFTPVDVPGSDGTVVHKVNNRGQVVGVYGDPAQPGVQHGFTLHRDRYRTVDFPGATITGINSSNTRGTIVGYFSDEEATPSTVVHGAIFKRGRLTTFDAPGAPAGRAATTAYDINDLGEIVGAKLPIPDPATTPPAMDDMPMSPEALVRVR